MAGRGGTGRDGRKTHLCDEIRISGHDDGKLHGEVGMIMRMAGSGLRWLLALLQ